MGRGAWWAIVRGAPKQSDMTEQLTLSLIQYDLLSALTCAKSLFPNQFTF